MPKKATTRKATVLKYNCFWPADAHPLEIELACIRQLGSWELGGRKCGNGLPYHVKAAMKMLWPDMYWHRWTELLLGEFLKSPGRTGCFGPSSSQKSFLFSRAALTMFYGRPKGTTVLISSTTLDALERRIWGYVVKSHKEAQKAFPWLQGSLIESKQKLLADTSDTEGRSKADGVMGVACKKGGQWQGLEEYVGSKNEVLILVADEAHFMPMGFLDSLANLESNDNCYAAIMGNLPDVHNPLGAACEPKVGWESLPDTEKTRVYETKWKNGRAIQLIGMDSPNLDYPEGQEPFKGLIGRRYIEQCAQNYGRESDKFNMFASGKIPKASMNRTVFTKSQAIKFNAMENVKWGHIEVVRGYGMDAAYSGVGGDRTVGAPFIFGKDVEGKWKLWIGPQKIYPGSTTPKMSHSEAIVEECKLDCEAHGIPPEHVFYDGTGRSELTIAFARLWSAKVIPIEFGGPATERPAFSGEKHLDGDKVGNRKTCREMYDRFVSELWFAWAYCIVSDQMRGLSEEAIEEGCQRKWELVRGAKQCIETKEDMKERGLRSPDLSDCVCVSVEGARRLGFPLGKDAIPVQRKTNVWLEHMREENWRKIKEHELV